MKKYVISAVLLAIIQAVTVQCKHDADFSLIGTSPDLPQPTASCNPDSVYFVNTVLPIITSSCAKSGCHDTGGESGVILTDYYRIKITGKVKPGNSGGSLLYKVLNRSGETHMPPSSDQQLTPKQKAAIAKWIDQGAKYNYCSECYSDQFAFAANIFPIIQTNCTGCHGGNTPTGGIYLDDYTSIKAAADEGSLYGSVAHLIGYQPMPQNATMLSQCNIDQIKNWIDNGAPNN